MKVNRNLTSIPKKWIITVGIFLVLLVADYGFKVHELARLNHAYDQWIEIENTWDESYKEDYEYFLTAKGSSSFWRSNKITGFDKFVEESETASLDLLLLKTRLERSPILPWHNKIQFANQDSARFLELRTDYFKAIAWEYGDNDDPKMIFNGTMEWYEALVVASNSFTEARPRIKLLDSLYDSW